MTFRRDLEETEPGIYLFRTHFCHKSLSVNLFMEKELSDVGLQREDDFRAGARFWVMNIQTGLGGFSRWSDNR